VLVGPNGHGKTSFLEALLYLEVFRSFRGAREGELVRFGADGFRVEAETADERTSGQSDSRTVGQSDGRTGGRADERTGGRADRRTGGRADKGIRNEEIRGAYHPPCF
jgi:recombinational DNA repair ATPase RecF